MVAKTICLLINAKRAESMTGKSGVGRNSKYTQEIYFLSLLRPKPSIGAVRLSFRVAFRRPDVDEPLLPELALALVAAAAKGGGDDVLAPRW